MYGGRGADFVRANRGANVLSGGPNRDIISAGAGDDRIRARDGSRDEVGCGSGHDVAIIDAKDEVHRGCERVIVR
jgi:Ca2+-binding RTX toxin-like protein